MQQTNRTTIQKEYIIFVKTQQIKELKNISQPKEHKLQILHSKHI